MSKTEPNANTNATDDAQSETYNRFGQHGTVIEDPDYLLSLADAGEQYGDDHPAYTPREVAEWLYMAVKGVPYGEVRERVDDDAPVIVLENRTEGTVSRYNAATGKEVTN